MAEFVQVSTTIDSREEAAALARDVVGQRLAACAQIVGPVLSTYWWEGELETAEELIVLIKTTADRCDDLLARIRAVHSYDVPEAIVTPISGGDPAYLTWVKTETGDPPGT